MFWTLLIQSINSALNSFEFGQCEFVAGGSGFQSDYLAVQVSWDCSNDKINHDEKVETLLLSSNTEFKISTLTFFNLIDRIKDFTWYI